MKTETTKIIRYSTQGFRPQYQAEHLKNVNYHLHEFNINDFPEHLKYIIPHTSHTEISKKALII